MATTNPGAGQRIEVQYIQEDEVIVLDGLDGLDDSPEDVGDAVARSLGARDAEQAHSDLESTFGGSSASVERVSRRPR